MNRARVAKAKERTEQAEARLEAMKMDALWVLDHMRQAIERPGVPLRRLAFLAFQTHRVLGRFWSEASWVAGERRNLRAAKAGRKPVTGPGWPFPGDVMEKRERRGAA